jgi:hypothetical protein
MHRSVYKNGAKGHVIARALVRGVCMVLAAVLLAACSTATPPSPPSEPKTITVIDPVELARAEWDGQWITADKRRCVSPDGRHLLVAIQGDPAEVMAAVPLPKVNSEGDPNVSPTGSPGELTALGEPINLYSVDTTWTKHNLVQWIPVGWLSDEQCVFIVHGWQNQGEHYGERGTAVMLGDMSSKTATPVAFMDSPQQGETVDEAVLTESGTLILRVSERIWSVDIEAREKKLVREDFPNYGPLFYFAISPKGDYAVYSLNADDRLGIFIMDLATGEERPLLPAGDTFSFYPSWSPDGKYVMAYTAKSWQDASGQGSRLYTLIPGEDGPFPAAEVITVVDVQGNVVKTISLQGAGEGQVGESEPRQFLFQFDWLADSRHVVFVSGPVTIGKWGEVLSRDYDGVWIGDVTLGEEPVKCTDLTAVEEEIGGDISYVYPVSSMPDGTGALLTVIGDDMQSLWRVTSDGSATKVLDGWWETGWLQPSFLDAVAGVVGEEGGSRIYLVGPSEVAPVGDKSGDGMSIVAYTDDTLIATSYNIWDNRSVIYVYGMLREIVQE